MESSKISALRSWLEQVEEHAKAKNLEQLKLLLKDFYRFPLREYGQENSKEMTDLWDQVFSLMLEFLEWDDFSLKETAFHNVKISLWREERSSRLDVHIQKILPVLGRVIEKNPEWFFDFFNYFINFLEEPHPLINEWLANIEKGNIAPHLEKNYIEAVKIYYFYPKKTWEEAKYFLFGTLDHLNTLVRAYAARVLGMWYHDHSPEELSPSLKEIIGFLTEKEIERPGIAGPFMSDYYSIDMEYFSKESGLDVKEWIFEILEKRKTAEPNTLPCSNSIDFYSHEIFSTPDELKRLIKIGQISIAQEAAGDYDIDFKSILLEMEGDDDPKVIRDVSFYLVSHYCMIHSKAQNLGMVKVIHLPDIQIFLLNFDVEKTSYGHTIYIYSKNPENHFVDEKAWEWIDRFLPASVRGEELYRSPWEDEALKQVALQYPWTYMTYTHGASVRLEGSNKDKIWKRIMIHSNLPRCLWDPEKVVG